MPIKKITLLCGGIVAAVSACAILLAAAEVHYVYFDRHNLPDLGPFTRFEFSTVGHIYDAGDRPLIELAREQREISRTRTFHRSSVTRSWPPRTSASSPTTESII